MHAGNFFCAIILTFVLTLFPSLAYSETKICLTMIVKNESKIIERCLNSVKDTIDCISICDTGSTDNTVQVIEDYMHKNKIPGKVYHDEWKNFGSNRTQSAQYAKKTLEELNYPLEKSYLLFLDADMIFVKEPSFDKNQLTENSYMLLQKMTSCEFYNKRLVRASLPWTCVGVTHEYWTCKTVPPKEIKLTSAWIDDLDDGGCKSDKFERDVQMLLKGLTEEPYNPRYMFYLAQSYRCLKKYEEAIQWYQTRVNMRGWPEEVWFSKYMIGQCYEEMGRWDKALEAHLDAYQYRPERAEPLQNISTYYRNNHKYGLAYLFAKLGSLIPYPNKDTLFISYPVYDYLLDQDLSIAAYYTPYKEEGCTANNRLMLKKGIPPSIKNQAYKNATSYASCLKAAYKPVVIDLPVIREGSTIHYNPMNPSIQKSETGYDLICRTVNYIQIGALHFKSLDVLDPSNTVKTRNFLVKYDKEFNRLSQQEIVEALPRVKYHFTNIVGLEDPRLFKMNGSFWFSCTTTDTNPCKKHQISLCKLSDDHTGSIIQVDKLIPLFGPNPTVCEKNWLPFLVDDELYMVYSYAPFTIYKPTIDIKRGVVNQAAYLTYNTEGYDLSRFSGSAAPIPFDDGYLMLIHETIIDNQRTYLHRFLTFNKEFKIQKVSNPFIFLHKGIEYAASMTIDHTGKNLIIPIGLEDREAHLCFVSLDTVREMLKPLP